MRNPKAIYWLADSLNELAEYWEAGEKVPSHDPPSPWYWFLNLARELAQGEAPLLESDDFRQLLSPIALNYIEIYRQQLFSRNP